MVKDAFIAMIMLGTRINAAKYCSRIISPLSFVKLNFVGDVFCALFILLLSALEIIPVPLNLYFNDREALIKGVPAGFFSAFAEIFCVSALNRGPTGPVSAIISFSVVIVSLLSWTIYGIALTWI